MSIKIDHKVSHREWGEASLTLEQFTKFNNLYCEEKGRDLYPTFAFNNGEVHVDEGYDIDHDGRISISSYANGVIWFSKSKDQYIESYLYTDTELGQLLSVNFTVKEDMQEVFDLLGGTNK